MAAHEGGNGLRESMQGLAVEFQNRVKGTAF